MRIAAVIAAVALATLASLAFLRGDDKEQDPLLARVKIQRYEYLPGEPIALYLEVENIQEQPVRLEYTGDPPYTFSVGYWRGDAFIRVWSVQSEEPVPARLVMDRELAPGEKVQLGAIWDQTNEATGEQTPAGVYEVVGRTLGSAARTCVTCQRTLRSKSFRSS